MTNLNERTNTLLYKKYASHFLFWKGWCFLCVRGELETGTDCYILTQSSSDHSSTSSSFWLGCSTVGHWGPQPSVCRWLSLRHLVSNWNCNSNCQPQAVCGTWLYNCLTYTCFLWAYAYRIQPRPQVMVIFRYLRPDAPVSLLFTQVHLLIDGSVEGQYVTYGSNKTVWHLNSVQTNDLC